MRSPWLVVNTGHPNAAPVITSVANEMGGVDRPYTYTVIATDPDDDTLTYYLTQAPDGMTIDRNRGVINWTPTSRML